MTRAPWFHREDFLTASGTKTEPVRHGGMAVATLRSLSYGGSAPVLRLTGVGANVSVVTRHSLFSTSKKTLFHGVEEQGRVQLFVAFGAKIPTILARKPGKKNYKRNLEMVL